MKIFFPTNYSNAAENAFLYALRLAEQLNAGINVMHAFEGSNVMSWVEEWDSTDERMDPVALDEFEKYKVQVQLLKRIAKENNLQHIEVNYVLREAPESIVQSILDETREHPVDLIVIGTEGARGWKELFFGSTASRVTQSAPCPVVLVPDTANFRGIHKIGMTLEFKPGEMEAIKKSLDWARQLESHLECIHIDSLEANKKINRLAEYAAAFAYEKDISFHNHYDLNVERGILDYMKSNHIDMVIMEMREESHFRELFSFSIAKRVSYHSDIPLLAFPIKTTG